MDINTVYQKERHDFGRPVNGFGPSEVIVLDEFLPDDIAKGNNIEQNPTHLDIQAVATLSESYVNTETVVYKPQGMLHLEGGWPKEVDQTEKEHTARYKKKVEKDEDYLRQVRQMVDDMEGDLRQNYSLDIYQDYFPEGEDFIEYSADPPSAKTLACFKDPQETKRSVCTVSWHPDAGRKLAVAFSIMQFQDDRSLKCGIESYIWDVNNPNTPETSLTPPSPLTCLEYNPKDPNLLAGGSYNGLVSSYDTRVGSAPKDVSVIESSHRDPVFKIQWLPGKTPFECVSTSTDAQVLWWDVRKLQEPIESLWLSDKTDNGTLLGGTALEYSGAGGKFMVGSESGKIVACSRKGKTPADKIGNIWEAHCGPVYALTRNAYFPKFYVTVGDWCVKVWNDEIRTPILTSKCSKSYVTDAIWSPTRPGVFVSTKLDGTLDVWDIFSRQNDPTLSLQVDADALRCVKIQEAGSYVATGSADGKTYMLELNEGLSNIQPGEKVAVLNMLERESKREKNLEARAKELKAKAKRMEEAQNKGEEEPGEPWDVTVKTIEDSFWSQVGVDDPDATLE
jgi:dynein intermediate chain 2